MMFKAALILFSLLTTLVYCQDDQECKSNGFFRNADDCTRFYRCVDLTGRGYFQKYTFSCPAGTVFDEVVSVCNWPYAAAPCEAPEEEEVAEVTTEAAEEEDVSSVSNSVLNFQYRGRYNTGI
jgi:hypothetical protein